MFFFSSVNPTCLIKENSRSGFNWSLHWNLMLSKCCVCSSIDDEEISRSHNEFDRSFFVNRWKTEKKTKNKSERERERTSSMPTWILIKKIVVIINSMNLFSKRETSNKKSLDNFRLSDKVKLTKECSHGIDYNRCVLRIEWACLVCFGNFSLSVTRHRFTFK